MARLLLALALTTGCYRAHERDSDASLVAQDGGVDGASDGGVDGASDGGVDGASDGGVDAAGQLCGCPGSVRTVCILPLMCCPATETCENPAHFNCSGSNHC